MSKPDIAEEISRIVSFNNLMETAGKFETRLYEDLAEENRSFLKFLLDSTWSPSATRTESLLQRFNNTEISGSIIYHLRMISSSWVAANAKTYEALVPDCLSLDEYRKNRLEIPDGRLDELGIAVLVDWLLIPIGIELNIIKLESDGVITTMH
jgi:ubiquitin thioesterase protein OTUB1